MLAKVLIRDQDKNRETRIYRELERFAAGRYQVFTAEDKRADPDFDLILCPQREASCYQENSPEAKIMTWEQEFTQPLRISLIHQEIEKNLAIWRKRRRSLTEGKKSNLSLLFCFDNCRKDKWLPSYLKALLKQGLYVLYLPLKPLYRINDLEEKSLGKKLTDLLITLDQQESDSTSNLGHYLFMHSSGYMTFRLSTEADDLISCPPHLLRSLLLIIRQYLDKKSEPAIALIDCEQLGLDTTIRLIQLCDTFYADGVFTENDAGKVARRELAKILAALPASVEFRLLNEVRL